MTIKDIRKKAVKEFGTPGDFEKWAKGATLDEIEKANIKLGMYLDEADKLLEEPELFDENALPDDETEKNKVVLDATCRVKNYMEETNEFISFIKDYQSKLMPEVADRISKGIDELRPLLRKAEAGNEGHLSKE